MVKELSDKHKRAINAGRLAAGYPKIKWKKNDKKKTKKKTQYAKSIKDLKKGKPLNPKSQKGKYGRDTERKLKKNGGRNA